MCLQWHSDTSSFICKPYGFIGYIQLCFNLQPDKIFLGVASETGYSLDYLRIFNTACELGLCQPQTVAHLIKLNELNGSLALPQNKNVYFFGFWRAFSRFIEFLNIFLDSYHWAVLTTLMAIARHSMVLYWGSIMVLLYYICWYNQDLTY